MIIISFNNLQRYERNPLFEIIAK